MSFGKDFIWGLATSAGQVEGGAAEDGRGPSIWDVFASKPGKIHNGTTPAVACDSYHRFERDVENLKFVGVDSYRMSISWSRVMPEGKGRRLLQTLLRFPAPRRHKAERHALPLGSSAGA